MWTVIIFAVALILFFVFRKPKAKPLIETKIEEPKQIFVEESKPEIDVLRKNKFDFVVIDFEYANSKTQFACQLGIVPIINGEIVDKIEYLIQPPGNEYGLYEMDIHKITPEMTKNSPTFDKIWNEIESYFTNQTLVCHGREADISTLTNTLKFYSIPIPAFNVINTKVSIANKAIEVLCEAYNVTLIRKHHALYDALALAEVFIKFSNNYEIDRSILDRPTEKKEKSLFADKKSNPKFSKVKEDVENPENPFYHKKVVITGNFISVRDDIKAKFYDLGADNNGTISKKTDYFFVGDGAGPVKMQKIQELLDSGADIKVFKIPELESVMNDNFDFLKK